MIKPNAIDAALIMAQTLEAQLATAAVTGKVEPDTSILARNLYIAVTKAWKDTR